MDVGIEYRDNKRVLAITANSDGKETNDAIPLKGEDPSTLSFCGDSGWWYQSDAPDPWASNSRSILPAPFSPVLIESHGLGTAQGKSFPADLALSGQARFWNLEREYGDTTEEVCQVNGFVGSGMTLLRFPPFQGVHVVTHGKGPQEK